VIRIYDDAGNVIERMNTRVISKSGAFCQPCRNSPPLAPAGAWLSLLLPGEQ
jgi:hypothetical protein